MIRRAGRRRRAAPLAAAAAVLTAAGVGTGVAVSGGAPSSTARGASPTSPPAGPPARCPAAVPHLVTPGAAGGLPGRDAAIAPPDVTAITVCRYADLDAAGALEGWTLTGAQARQLAAQLDALPTAPADCPAGPPLPVLVLLPRTAAGDAAVIVGNGPACGRFTDGTGTRFGPQLLGALAAAAGPTN